ncbi:hypothetical protein FWG95_00785, partial [Candidatus Saccharibacteria bacterium]|nr:hypothetical protein [Candidatus Saccharibacteria bacterium]
MNIKHTDKNHLLKIGFVAMFIMTTGMTILQFVRPVDGASSTGTCLPITKGGTGVCTLAEAQTILGIKNPL